MPDNEFAIKITGDASQAKEAIGAAKEQLDKAGKSVGMLADLIGVKVPDAFKKMIASSELVGPALAEAFGPLSLIIFGIEILQRVAEKMEQMDEEAEKHRLSWLLHFGADATGPSTAAACTLAAARRTPDTQQEET